MYFVVFLKLSIFKRFCRFAKFLNAPPRPGPSDDDHGDDGDDDNDDDGDDDDDDVQVMSLRRLPTGKPLSFNRLPQIPHQLCQ